tara:strand:+ start:3258 stop:4193 length:936 start_codon:yes stop_codon:yes gene_type:complete
MKEVESSSNNSATKAFANSIVKRHDSNSLLLSRKSKNLLKFEKNKNKKEKEKQISKNKNNIVIGNQELLDHIELLKSQLENAGLRPISEITSYEDGKSNLIKALEACIEDDSFFNLQEVDKWDDFIKNHPKYIEEQVQKNKLWVEDAMERGKDAIEEQKKYIPENIFDNASVVNLQNKGLSLNLATRIMRNRALWLIRMDVKDIANVHIADLKFKYSFTGLDIIELRALYACLPDKFEHDPKNEKENWKNSLIQSIKDIENQEKNGTLPKRLIRNSAYNNTNKTQNIKVLKFQNPIANSNLFSEICKRRID